MLAFEQVITLWLIISWLANWSGGKVLGKLKGIVVQRCSVRPCVAKMLTLHYTEKHACKDFVGKLGTYDFFSTKNLGLYKYL